MNWLDIILLFIIIWSAWRGLATGFFAGVARLAGLVLGAIFAYNYYLPLAEYADKQWALESKIRDWLPFSSAGGQVAIFPETLGQQSISGVQNFNNLISHGILDAIAFLVIFFIVAQLTCWIGLLFSKTARLVFLGPVDRLGGLALGTLRGVIIVFVLLALLVPLETPAFSSPDLYATDWLAQAIGHSKIIPVFWQFLLKLKMIFPELPIITV
jgi:uncharacterized membrane protein required for colicin V production